MEIEIKSGLRLPVRSFNFTVYGMGPVIPEGKYTLTRIEHPMQRGTTCYVLEDSSVITGADPSHQIGWTESALRIEAHEFPPRIVILQE